MLVICDSCPARVVICAPSFWLCQLANSVTQIGLSYLSQAVQLVGDAVAVASAVPPAALRAA